MLMHLLKSSAVVGALGFLPVCQLAENAHAQGASEVMEVAGHEYESGWISVSTYGEGPDVILIPGLASSAEIWDQTVKVFQSSYRLHVVQVSGFAGAPRSDILRDNIVDGLSSDLADYIQTENLEQPIIVGHSMGGFTALNTALAHPDKIGHVISVDSLPFYPALFNPAATVETSRARAAQMTEQMKAMSAADYAASQKRNVRIYAQSPEAQNRIAKWGVQSDREVVAAAFYELMTTDLRPKLSEIETPVTIIYAHDEKMAMPADAISNLYESQYEGLKNLTAHRIDDSFHFIMVDQPAAFHAILKSTLEARS